MPPRRQYEDDPVVQSRSLEHSRRMVLMSLQSGDFRRLLQDLVEAGKNPAFPASLPPTCIAEICRTLDFEELVRPFKRLQYSQKIWKFAMARNHVAKVVEQLREGAQVITAMMEHWRQAQGCRFKLQDYETLLSLANETGDPDLAEVVFETMQADYAQPGVESWNHLLEVQCRQFFSDQYGKGRGDRHQSTGKSTSTFVPESEQKKVHTNVQSYFREMALKGIAPNTDTYCLLLESMGRSRNFSAAKALLNDVWGIDINTILAEGSTDASPKNDLTPGSFIYPTQKLLESIAVTCGACYVRPTDTLRILEHVSERFAIPIEATTWNQMLQGAFNFDEFARSDIWYARVRDLSTQEYPMSSLDELWDKMQTPPHKSRPDLSMYHTMMRSYFVRGQPRRLYDALLGAMESVEMRKSHVVVPDTNDPSFDNDKWRALLVEGRLRARFGRLTMSDIARSVFYNERGYICFWLLVLLDRSSWHKKADHWPLHPWLHRLVPELLCKFWYYHPSEALEYETLAGTVRFDTSFRHRHEIRMLPVQSAQDDATGLHLIQWRSEDTLNQDKLAL